MMASNRMNAPSQNKNLCVPKESNMIENPMTNKPTSHNATIANTNLEKRSVNQKHLLSLGDDFSQTFLGRLFSGRVTRTSQNRLKGWTHL